MAEPFEVRWEGVLPGTPDQVWDAITVHAEGWVWKVEYEPWVGGAERGLTPQGGSVTVWDQPKRFVTRAEGSEPGETSEGFNQLSFVLVPHPEGTRVSYVHNSVFTENYDVELDACRRHTEFYHHSLAEYVRYFAGREAAYVSADGPESSAKGGMPAVRAALGLSDDVAAGQRVRLTPAGLDPIDGVVDYSTDAFLGVRSADALYRVYGRDAWGYPVGVAHHLFAGGVDQADQQEAWQRWLTGVFEEKAAG